MPYLTIKLMLYIHGNDILDRTGRFGGEGELESVHKLYLKRGVAISSESHEVSDISFNCLLLRGKVVWIVIFSDK